MGVLDEAVKLGKAGYGVLSDAIGGGRISTRQPSGLKAEADPSLGTLQIDTGAMERGGTLGKNIEFLRKGEYPGLSSLSKLPDDEAVDLINNMQQTNLKWIMEKLPEGFRDRAKLWYVGANRFSDELSKKYGSDRASVSGVLASLSPQKDWFQNASLAERVMDAAINNRNFPWSSEMDNVAKQYNTFIEPKNLPTWKKIKGKKYSELETLDEKAMWIRAYDQAHNPRTYRALTPEGDLGEIVLKGDGTPAAVGWGSFGEIKKAVKSLESNGDLNIISDAMGDKHKVRSFFNNIEVPFSDFGDITIDTHAIAAGWMKPLGGSDELTSQGLGLKGGSSDITGAKGNYGQIADNYRAIAGEYGILPRETQSVVWERVRGLFGNKNADLKKKVDDIWSAIDKGDLTQEQGLNLIEEASGGYADAGWINEARPVRGINTGGSTMYSGALPAGLATGGALALLPEDGRPQ